MTPASCYVPESPRGVSGIGLLDESVAGTKPSSHGKSVSFQLEDSYSGDADDCLRGARVKCYYAPLRAELTKEEREKLYWSKKHFKSFKKESKKLARSTDEEKHGVYLRTFLDTYSSPPTDERSVGVVNTRDLSCLPLATASVRGLERYIFPGLVQDQAQAKQTVLKAQSKIPDEMGQQQKAFLLASTSAILSRQSRHIARAIGHADSVVALSIYKKTFLPKKKEKR